MSLPITEQNTLNRKSTPSGEVTDPCKGVELNNLNSLQKIEEIAQSKGIEKKTTQSDKTFNPPIPSGNFPDFNTYAMFLC